THARAHASPKAALDWSVPEQMLENPDIPNHQAWVPDYAKSKAAWQACGKGYRTAQSADIDADLDTLKTTLQGIFDAAPDKNPQLLLPASSRRDTPRRGGA